MPKEKRVNRATDRPPAGCDDIAALEKSAASYHTCENSIFSGPLTR